jgi:hypothetical protein
MCISAQGYHNIVQNLDKNFYLKVFSGEIQETKKKKKKNPKLYKPEVITSVTAPKNGKILEFF